ncbi:MAG: hypothetical protein COS90_04040 [Deltaproteobacteria bacterium CG07_land_8_20_14_0_80_60_11]|nr:MAG: hypothetical protein COS90_04040 [Deltaproteobacteria bacterium CG07_land_8_20_14_0_80_60_11]
MRHFLKLLAIVALVAFPGAAGAQDIRINPVPPHLKPQWTQVPGAPQVSWAPNLPTDVFRYRGKYYFFWENYFYRGPAPEGPWKAVVKVPEVFYAVDPAYFKTVKPAGEAPAAVGSTPPPKAKIIDLPPTAPPAQPLPEPGSTPPGSPEAPGATTVPPKVM